jgi:hypothetical protein
MPALLESVSDLFAAIFSTIAAVVQDIFQAIAGVFNTLLSAVGTTISGLAQTFEGLVKFLLSTCLPPLLVPPPLSLSVSTPCSLLRDDKSLRTQDEQSTFLVFFLKRMGIAVLTQPRQYRSYWRCHCCYLCIFLLPAAEQGGWCEPEESPVRDRSEDTVRDKSRARCA